MVAGVRVVCSVMELHCIIQEKALDILLPYSAFETHLYDLVELYPLACPRNIITINRYLFENGSFNWMAVLMW